MHDKTKTPDRNDLKLGTVVVLDSLSKPIDLGFNMSRIRVIVRVRLLPADQTLCENAVGVTDSPQLHNALSNDNVKWYFRDTSNVGWTIV